MPYKNYSDQLKYSRKYKREHKKEVAEYFKKWRKKNRKKHNKLMRLNYKRNKLKQIARVNAYSIPIPKILCQNCHSKPATQRHHEDYSKPLDVLFVCRKCNEKL